MGIIHRDIKPSNVIVCRRGGVHDVAKLLDFGLVQQVGLSLPNEKLTTQGTILGSPAYMSPEQAMGKPHLDARTDIYSLGGVAYYLVTGKPPFQRETPMETLMAHARDPVVPPSTLAPDLPRDLEEVILRCLEKEPTARYGDVLSLSRALASCRCAGDWDEEYAAAWWEEESAGKLLPPSKEQVTVTLKR
jgi:serine/threonine-protein kinase